MTMTLSRRKALQTAGTMGAATVFGIGSAMATAVVPKKWSMSCDVLVVGGGAAGTFAAVSAKEAGAGKVILIDKNPALFLNSTSYSDGYFSVSGSKFQKAAGIKDPGTKAFAQAIYKIGKNIGDPAVIKTYAEHSADAVDWLQAHGINWSFIKNPAYDFQATLSNGTGSGAVYVKILSEQAQKLGISIFLDTRATQLITTPDGGKVLGIACKDEDGEKFIEVKKGVVLATGGFFGDVNLIDRYMPEHHGAITCSAPSSTGDGMLMGMKIGADTCNLGYGAVYAYGVPIDPAKRRGLIFRGHFAGIYGTIAVGKDGRRFVNDETGAAGVTIAAQQRGYKMVYLIATEAQIDDFMKNDPSQVIGWNRERWLQELKENKIFCHKANTIGELADKLGIDRKGFEAEIKKYNGFVKAGKDADYNRKNLKGTFEKGPFYGFACPRVAVLTSGGLRVSGNLEVLDVYGKPIRGLFAAGETVGGIHGASYATGNAIGAALTLGRVAGQRAAASK